MEPTNEDITYRLSSTITCETYNSYV